MECNILWQDAVNELHVNWKCNPGQNSHLLNMQDDWNTCRQEKRWGQLIYSQAVYKDELTRDHVIEMETVMIESRDKTLYEE